MGVSVVCRMNGTTGNTDFGWPRYVRGRGSPELARAAQRVTLPGVRVEMNSTATRDVPSATRIPVWSCGGTNLASLRIAARLGFTEVSRRVYLIPDLEADPIGEP